MDEHEIAQGVKAPGSVAPGQPFAPQRANANDPYDLSSFPVSDGSEFLAIAKKSGVPVFNQDGERIQ